MNRLILNGVRSAGVLVLVMALGACASFGLRDPVPAVYAETAQVIGSPVIRYWGDEPLPPKNDVFNGLAGKRAPTFLALSGGGINGAYGAGFLIGWTDRGDRPKFDIVTGISVGALIAPMAFLGPRYDKRMESVFANLSNMEAKGPGIIAALFGAPAIADNTQLRQAIAAVVDEQALKEIAEQHRAGRRLFIGTSNLDAERPVVWDIGAIANSSIANRLELIHTIMLASAAVPGIFPPVLIEVQAGGRTYDELHVDGGVTQQVVLLPGGTVANARGSGTLYVIYNGTIAPVRDVVEPVTSVAIIERALPTLLKYRGRGDIILLEKSVKSLGVKYKLSAISPSFPQPESQVQASPQWLTELFASGYRNGKAGAWQRSPTE